MYCIYFEEAESRFYLMDWIVSSGIDNPQFCTKRDYAMRFQRFDVTLRYLNRLRALGYSNVHIKDLATPHKFVKGTR